MFVYIISFLFFFLISHYFHFISEVRWNEVTKFVMSWSEREEKIETLLLGGIAWRVNHEWEKCSGQEG